MFRLLIVALPLALLSQALVAAVAELETETAQSGFAPDYEGLRSQFSREALGQAWLRILDRLVEHRAGRG